MPRNAFVPTLSRLLRVISFTLLPLWLALPAASGQINTLGRTALTLSPPQLMFGTVAVGTNSNSQVVTALNAGQAVIRISSVVAAGDFSQQNNCPVSLAPGESCQISVVFQPLAAGTLNGAIEINETSGAGKQRVPLSGIGESAQIVANAGGPYSGTVGQAITFDGSGSTGPSGQTLSYAWNFGDNSSGSGVNPTHSYTSVGSYTVTLTVTDTAGAIAMATTTATVTNPAPVANAGGPYSGTAGQSVGFDGSKSTAPNGQTLTYAWNFGDSSTGSGVNPAHTYSKAGTYTVSLTVTDTAGATGTATTTATIAASLGPPTISGISPSSGPIGTVVTVTGTNLTGSDGPAPVVTLAQQGGGTLSAPVSAFTATSLSFVIPPGAATGNLQVTVGTQSATSTSPLTVTTSSTFSLAVSPGTGQLIQGQSTALAVTVTSTNGFSGTAALTVTGLPSGVTASFKPTSIAAGQTSVLTLTAPASQSTGTSTLSITATATIDDQSVSQSATASLKVMAVSTTFLGRTVVDDAQETPIAGVTVKFLGVTDKGTTTGCTGTATSDGGGNFMLSNLAANCVGPQLISYDGTTATAPAGKYAGVNLYYTLVSGQVVASPVLVHLPRIDNAETVQVQQNSPTDQIFTFSSIPGLQVAVYAGTTIALDDGSKPNPFPLAAMDIPLDRLPEQIASSGTLMNFVVAFQPANATANQPVAVTFPNPLGIEPATSAVLSTLDPTRGVMVPYGSTTVSNDGRNFIPDMDPNYPGHRYGLVHFDWHSPVTNEKKTTNTSSECPKCETPMPIDLSTGVQTYTTTDLQVRGGRGSIGISRTYRSLDPNPGPFGIGTGSNYSYAIDITNYLKGLGTINLLTPNGNQYLLSIAQSGVFLNGTIPLLRGSVLTPDKAGGTYSMRFPDGTTYTFSVFNNISAAGAYLTSISDLNGNTTTITLNPSQPLQVTAVTDPVGRSLNLAYDSSNRVKKITDPIGRSVTYVYNGQGTLETFTDAAGGVTQYTYDAQNDLTSITDPRGIVTEQNTYNESFDGRVTQQVAADGGVTKFSYTLLNPTVPTSPVLQTVLTDPLGNQTTYRFDTAGFLISATDPTGQTRTLTRDTAHNNLVASYTGAGVCVVCGDPTRGNVSYTFDQFGNTLAQTDALGNTTTYTYDLRFNKVASITNALGDVTRIAYDANGNPLTITDGNGNATQLTYDSFGEITQVTDAVGAKTVVAYDSFGNVASITDALGHATQLSYDAVSRLSRVIDALGRNSTASFDNLDRVTSQTDPRGSTTSFAYDPIGNLLSYTDAKGNAVKFSYDGLSRLQTRTSQLGKLESYQYDSNSNPIQHTDRRGQVSTFKYDGVNRLVNETYPDATVARSYDANSRLTQVADSQGGDFGFVYDAAGRLLTQSEPTGIVEYTRDALERVTTRQVVGQAAVAYKYDAAGNMLSAAESAAGVTYKYDARNLPQTLTRTNGVITSYSFDQLGQVLSIIHANGAATLNTQNYTYDPVGDRTAIKNDIGQPLATQTATSTVDKANELLTFGSTTYAYDANGNRASQTGPGGTTTYTWDGRNRLATVMNSDGTTTKLGYDFTRNLLDLSTSGGTSGLQRFVVDNLTNVAAVADASGSSVSILTGDSIDSNFASIDLTGAPLFEIEDALSSILGVTNASGALVSRFEYEPFGQTTGAPLTKFPFSYTGRTQIAANTYYDRNRFYDALAGRFLSEDPIGLAAGDPNLYRYSLNNPVLLSDRLGLLSGKKIACEFGFGAAGSLIGGLVGGFISRSPSGLRYGSLIGGSLGSGLGNALGEGCTEMVDQPPTPPPPPDGAFCPIPSQFPGSSAGGGDVGSSVVSGSGNSINQNSSSTNTGVSNSGNSFCLFNCTTTIIVNPQPSPPLSTPKQ